jgi:hypothetical protein
VPVVTTKWPANGSTAASRSTGSGRWVHAGADLRPCPHSADPRRPGAGGRLS